MRKLRVHNFSCIDEAELEIGKLTVLIGPQASGKSVLCKLAYFLIDCAKTQERTLRRLQTYETFIEDLKARFCEWFPIGAWGHKKFVIDLTIGEYSICLTRKSYKGKPSDDFRVKTEGISESCR